MAFTEKLKPLKKKLSQYFPIKTNIFTKYFLTFAFVFFILLSVLGTSLFIFVNDYSDDIQTNLLKENTESISQTVGSMLSAQDMNKKYSIEKSLICETISTISSSIDADIFVCDLDGNVIFCRERADTPLFSNSLSQCEKHDDIRLDEKILSRVYNQGSVVEKTMLLNYQYFIVARSVVSGNNIIGSVVALASTGFQTLVFDIFRIFLVSAFFCLILAFICIYYLTKSMVKPLQLMSKATKQFAMGDFTYRIKIRGNDEMADLCRAFNDMAEALDVLEGTRRSFVSNVSHELKTPMTSIAGFIDGILDGTIPKDKQEYYLNIVSTEVRRLSRLVVSMLNMSKIESGDVEMKPSNYDISEQIINILLTFEQKISGKNIEIRGLGELKPAYLIADPDMIYQAIYNLFDNAVKFTNEGGFIQVTLKEHNSEIEVSVKNSGEGIKEEDLSHIFERFYKVDKSRSLDSKGSGLGLYIVKLMIEIHGGRVFAKSDGVDSAEFTFILPKQFSPIYKKEK